MARLAVVAYPDLGEASARWIEAARAEHDPQARLIAAHFTLVFPLEADSAAVASHARAACAQSAPMRISDCRILAARDPRGAGGHVFLIPTVGSEAIVALHDQLYGGVLRSALWLDMPYVPHITIGADAAFDRCARLAEQLAAPARTVAGVIERVEVIAVHATHVESLESVVLGG